MKGNCHKVVAMACEAAAHGADLVVFPELTLAGYPPEDLLEDAGFVQAETRARAFVARQVPPVLGCIVGGLAKNSRGPGKPLHNAAFLYEGGRQIAEVHKTLLPTYDVFDEQRHFEPSQKRHVVPWRDRKLGLHICEDLWNAQGRVRGLYGTDPVAELAALGADLFINICASPFNVAKHVERENLIRTAVQRHKQAYVFVNQVGANTELIFDGRSRVFDGKHWWTAPPFEEALMIWDEGSEASSATGPVSSLQALHDALVLGIRDYYTKTNAFQRVFIGLSGGIDSAVTCVLAVRALGADRVTGVAMPSAFSSEGSVRDARELADNLAIELLTLPIHQVVTAYGETLAEVFSGTATGVAEENLQARARGALLMALANKFNGLLLTTGNKSELAVGYATLYGDMSGGLSVLGDVFKMQVYALARHINAGEPCIPEATITKPPSAELKPGQTDQDSLPPYDVLDGILERLIIHREDAQTISRQTGQDLALVREIAQKVERNEYKRRQAPPCLRVSGKAFGPGRRLPMVGRRTTIEGS